MTSTRYKYCVVPKCTNSTVTTSDKLFISVPKNQSIREKWVRAMKWHNVSSKSTLYICEDHFNLEKDMANFMRHKFQGGNIILKRGVIPHKFSCDCQEPVAPAVVTGEKRRRKEQVAGIMYTAQSTTPNVAENVKPDEESNRENKMQKQTVGVDDSLSATSGGIGRKKSEPAIFSSLPPKPADPLFIPVAEIKQEVILPDIEAGCSYSNPEGNSLLESGIIIKQEIFETEDEMETNLEELKNSLSESDDINKEENDPPNASDVSLCLSSTTSCTVEPTHQVPSDLPSEFQTLHEPEVERSTKRTRRGLCASSVNFPRKAQKLSELATAEVPPTVIKEENVVICGAPAEPLPPQVSDANSAKDQFDVYGEYIAAKLRKLDWKSCAYAQKAIGDIIFTAEMGKYLTEREGADSSNSEFFKPDSFILP